MIKFKILTFYLVLPSFNYLWLYQTRLYMRLVLAKTIKKKKINLKGNINYFRSMQNYNAHLIFKVYNFKY